MGVCLVTGGGGPGIGSACCRALAAAGNIVWVTDVDPGSAEAVAGGLAESMWLRMDVGDPDSISAGIGRVLSESGRIDALVNSAGISTRATAAEMTLEDYERIMAVNLRGAWLCAKGAIASMMQNGGGSIVNIGTFHAQAADPEFSVYAASKAGLLALTRGIAREYGRYGVRCNSVSPGWVPSKKVRSDPEFDPQPYLEVKQMIPRLIDPDDVARATAFLIGEDSRAITAIDLMVDGGTSAMLRNPTSSREDLP